MVVDIEVEAIIANSPNYGNIDFGGDTDEYDSAPMRGQGWSDYEGF